MLHSSARSQDAGCAEIAEGRGAESAARGIALRRLHLLVDALKEVGHVGLCRSKSGLHPSLGRTPLAEVEQSHSTSLDLGELDDCVRFLADIANHVSPSFAARLNDAPSVSTRK
jgi:hypothetical protein